jgi:hypothetical protein
LWSGFISILTHRALLKSYFLFEKKNVTLLCVRKHVTVLCANFSQHLNRSWNVRLVRLWPWIFPSSGLSDRAQISRAWSRPANKFVKVKTSISSQLFRLLPLHIKGVSVRMHLAKSADKSDVYRSFQKCGSSVWNLLHVTLLEVVPGFLGNLWIPGLVE